MALYKSCIINLLLLLVATTGWTDARGEWTADGLCCGLKSAPNSFSVVELKPSTNTMSLNGL